MLTLVVTYAGVLGGSERTLLDFSGGLSGGVALACPEGPLAERARERGIEVLPTAAPPLARRQGVRDDVRAAAALSAHARQIRRLAKSLGPDLLLAWGMRSTIAAGAALELLRPRPALLVRHVDFLPSAAVARLVRAAAGRADRISVNSAAVARDLDPRGRLADRLSVISPGAELSAYDPSWTVGPDPEVLLLGAIVPWKRPDFALQAVAVAARELPGLQLTVAGAPFDHEGELLLQVLRRRAAGADLAARVTFAGALDDPRDALRRAWCLLHCADREPFGNVVLEALASGRPVVAPDGGGPAEVVDDSCGRLYPPGDVTAAAAALVGVLSNADRARALGAAGRERAGRYDAAEARRRFAALALEAASARSGGLEVVPG